MKKIITASLVFMALLITGMLIFYNYGCDARNTIETLIKEKKRINILVSGANGHKDDRFALFCIISINPVNSNIGVTFIPPSYKITMDEDNKEFSRLEDIELTSYNRILVLSTLRKDLQMNIPYFIELYPADVERVVDLLEGVELFVLDQIKDKSNLHIGVNYFDGKKTMRYINSVEANSIYLKFDRIQDVITTLYYNKEKYARFLNLALIAEMFNSVKTNLLPQEIYKIGEIIYRDGNLISTLLPGGFENGYYRVDDMTYKIYEDEFLKNLVMEPTGEPVTKIEILNGTAVPGLARKLRNNLIRDGLNVVEFGTSPYKELHQSIIICRKGNYQAVKKVSEIAGINRIYHIIDSSQLNNVLIIIGEDLVQ